MKNLKKLAIVALALAAVVAGIIYGIKLVKVIVLNWFTIVDWLTAASIYTGVITLILSIAGVIIMKKNYSIYGLVKDRDPEMAENMKDSSYFPDSGKHVFRKIGKTMAQISAALFFSEFIRSL